MFLAIRASPQVPSLVARSRSGKLEAVTGKALIRKGAETHGPARAERTDDETLETTGSASPNLSGKEPCGVQ